MFDGSQLTARVRVVGKDKQAVEFKNSTALTGKLLNKLLMFKNSTALTGKLLNNPTEVKPLFMLSHGGSVQC